MNLVERETGAIKIMVIDRDPLMQDCLNKALANVDGFQLVTAAREPESAIKSASVNDLNVLVIINRSERLFDWIEAGRSVKKLAPDLAVVMLVERDDLDRLSGKIFEQGPGWSYYLRDSMAGLQDFEQVIRSAAIGMTTIGPSFSVGTEYGPDAPKIQLTGGQQRVLSLVANGLSNQAIAEHLGVSYRTVEYHLNEVYRRMEYSNTSKFNRRVCVAVRYRESGVEELISNGVIDPALN